eukprot:comp17173_c0_seq1/m.16035 comp17173_c0_seq1/g.16035  ORF comp17173_c0_seq1/g.16035 comp17173_c0_seq1/m.16035 type:complete len:335 (-) comp17173_c0_seq1:236-1240(-)
MAGAIEEEPVYRPDGRANQGQERWGKFEERGNIKREDENRNFNSSSYSNDDQHPSKRTSNVNEQRSYYGSRDEREGQNYRRKGEWRREDKGRYDSRDRGDRGRPTERDGSHRSERKRSRSREPLPDRARFDTERKNENMRNGNRQGGSQTWEQSKFSTPLDNQTSANSKNKQGSNGGKDLQEVETDPRRLEQRQKQIDYGKNTLGYDNYVKAIPKNQRRGPEQPHTPDKHRFMSKRAWDGLIKVWRRILHKYDPTGNEEPTLSSDRPSPDTTSGDTEDLTIVPMSELEAFPFDENELAGTIEDEGEEEEDEGMDIFGNGGGVGGDLYEDVMDDL